MIVDELERMYQQAEIAIHVKQPGEALALHAAHEAPNDVLASTPLALPSYPHHDTSADI